jgi:hypothetical protein
MLYRSPRVGCKSSELTVSSTGTDAAGRREFWAAESERTGTNWRSLFESHCSVVDRLRATHGEGGSP